MKTLTVVCPAYNEAEGIRRFYDVLVLELSKLSSYTWSILFVVDGGTDGTFKILKEIASKDGKVRVLKFSRNFGHQMALLAGIDHAKSDVVITMDSDLQHPPSFIPKLLAEYEKGSDIVYTIRVHDESIGILRKWVGNMFYRFINLISDIPINRNASDFRLISGRVAALIRTSIRERNTFLRGIMSWVGFAQSSLNFTAHRRIAGHSKYSLSRLIQFALFGIVSFSKKPLRAASVVGMLFALFGFGVALVATIQYFTDNTLPSGWATVVVLLSVFGGVQLIFLGIIGEYIGAIFDEVKARPHYIIDEALNVHDHSAL